MHKSNLNEYRSFLKTIKEPLIRLDHVEVKKLEALVELEMLELNFRDSKDEDKFTKLSKDILELISWCEEEIDSLRDNYPIKIEQRKEASWVGHHRLPFPVVWDRETYNKVEPEVRTFGKKKDWLDWIIGNIEEGPGNYWSFNSQICNSCILDWKYYVDEIELLDDPEELFEEISFITTEFVDFLLTAKKIWSMKTGKEVFKSHEAKNTFISNSPINNLSMRTMQDRFDQGLNISWNRISNALKDFTNNNERIVKCDLNKGDEAKPGLRMFSGDEVIDDLLISTFKKNLSKMRRILKQGGKLPLPG